MERFLNGFMSAVRNVHLGDPLYFGPQSVGIKNGMAVYRFRIPAYRDQHGRTVHIGTHPEYRKAASIATTVLRQFFPDLLVEQMGEEVVLYCRLGSQQEQDMISKFLDELPKQNFD